MTGCGTDWFLRALPWIWIGIAVFAVVMGAQAVAVGAVILVQLARMENKSLWREAERDRREADAAIHEMAAMIVGLLDLLGVDDHPNPEIRGQIRALRRAVER